MIEKFQSIVATLTQGKAEKKTFSIPDAFEGFDEPGTDDVGVAQALNAAFLITLQSDIHPLSERAKRLLAHMAASPQWAQVAQFYINGLDLLSQEIENVCKQDPDFADRLKALLEWLSTQQRVQDPHEVAEKFWSVFFPEANGILTNRQKCIEALRSKRVVTITALNTTPITDPARQILFTSNVLLTICPPSRSPKELPYSEGLKQQLQGITHEPQLFFYDHPVQIGVGPEKNEVLYGLRGLDEAFEFERNRGNMPQDAKGICVLSVSTTHRGLKDVAKKWLQEELARWDRLKNLIVYVCTEADTRRLIDEILTPAVSHYLGRKDAAEWLDVFGVDGEYGRHYNFLKAIAPFWSIFIQPEIKATFKIDLDQRFPQKKLVKQVGSSAFEHFKTPLWGSHGLDSNGQHLELGMIAGSLVNEHDISNSLFIPDVPYPDRTLSPDEYIFFSTLPQALSTEAEMMTRYDRDELDGEKRCIQRIHVTGGTTGILTDSLRRYRPFTPSFIGRAEDQAYVLSVLLKPGTRLAYVHKDGLIMRHDKEAFARDAIESAYVGKLVGDYLRILYFSAYAKVLTKDVRELKRNVDPFTGCFISKIPSTVVYLRFALKAASFFADGKQEHGLEFVRTGAKRIMRALEFVSGQNSMLRRQIEKESLGWHLYYDALSAVEKALKDGEGFALELRQKAESLVSQCCISFD